MGHRRGNGGCIRCAGRCQGVPAVAASAAAGLVVSADGLAVAASAAAEVAVSAGGPTFAAGAAAALVAESLRAWAECRVG